MYRFMCIVIEMTSRICRYNCGVELGQFDEKENKYREAGTGMLHTRERCEAMKNTMRNNSKPEVERPTEAKEKEQPLTLDQIDVRLKRVEKMLFQSNSGT
jgi:hypothetical protein